MTNTDRASRRLRQHINDLTLEVIFRLVAMQHMRETTAVVRSALYKIDKYNEVLRKLFVRNAITKEEMKHVHTHMDFFAALRLCWKEGLPIKRKDKETIYGFVQRSDRRQVFVDEWTSPPEITSDMLGAEWEEADVREKV